MRLTAFLFLATAELLAATRPRYGGTLRMEIQARVTPDPPAATFATLAFEHLIELDDRGRPQAALATSWQADMQRKRWTFQLRPGVKLHDGTPLAGNAIAAAWQSSGVTGSVDQVVIE